MLNKSYYDIDDSMDFSSEGKKKLSVTKSNPFISIGLIGDSLICRPYDLFDLTGKIKTLLPKYYNITFTNYAKNGNTISNVRENQLDICLKDNPDIILLFWDSDCSDIDEHIMDLEQVNTTRKAYIKDLEYVVSEIIKRGIYFTFGGPAILGEGLIGKPSRFWFKDSMLDDYRLMNQKVAIKFGVDYMDIRQAFLDAIPYYWPFAKGYLTVDGEHENNVGSGIVAKHFADAILKYLHKKVN